MEGLQGINDYFKTSYYIHSYRYSRNTQDKKMFFHVGCVCIYKYYNFFD